MVSPRRVVPDETDFDLLVVNHVGKVTPSVGSHLEHSKRLASCKIPGSPVGALVVQ